VINEEAAKILRAHYEQTVPEKRRNINACIYLRIPWENAVQILREALQDKFGARGRIEFKKTDTYEPESDMYDFPNFVDVYLAPDEGEE
jgi:hypothetical protein